MYNDELGLTKYWLECFKRKPKTRSKFWYLCFPDVAGEAIVKTIEVTKDQYSNIVKLNIHNHKGWNIKPFTTHPNIDKMIEELLQE